MAEFDPADIKAYLENDDEHPCGDPPVELERTPLMRLLQVLAGENIREVGQLQRRVREVDSDEAREALATLRMHAGKPPWGTRQS